jgi:four helix bundle protein
MDEREFKNRTKRVGVRVIKLVASLPQTREADVIGRQMIRSGTAIGSNYRAACRAVSRRDMISKLGDVEEEADETLYWLEMLVESKIMAEKQLTQLMKEVDALLAMVVSSIRTMRDQPEKNPKSKTQNPK